MPLKIFPCPGGVHRSLCPDIIVANLSPLIDHSIDGATPSDNPSAGIPNGPAVQARLLYGAEASAEPGIVLRKDITYGDMHPRIEVRTPGLEHKHSVLSPLCRREPVRQQTTPRTQRPQQSSHTLRMAENPPPSPAPLSVSYYQRKITRVATGKYPYSGINSMIEMAQTVTEAPSPTLPSDSAFSTEFREFVAQCLDKKAENRVPADVLLGSPWLRSSGTSTNAKAVSICHEWVQSVQEGKQEEEAAGKMTIRPLIPNYFPNSNQNSTKTKTNGRASVCACESAAPVRGANVLCGE